MGKETVLVLDKDIVRLVGETKKSLKSYEDFIYSGLNEDFADIDKLFQKEEAVLGTNRFSTLAQKKYLRRISKKHARFGLLRQ